MKAETVQLETLKVESLSELQGWKEKQRGIVKSNPFVEIEDNKTYEEAKKNRTALVSARTDIQKQEKLIASKLKDFRTKVADASKELIEITQPHEEKQQDEVKRYESEKEAERLEKEKIEQKRKERIRAEINLLYNHWKTEISESDFKSLKNIESEMKEALIEQGKKEMEEFEMDFSEKSNLLRSRFWERDNYLTEREEARKEAEKLAAERAAFQKEQKEAKARAAKEEAERKAKAEKEGAERKAQEEKQRAARDVEENKIREQREKERIAFAKERKELEAEKQRLAAEEAERHAKIEAERKAKEEAEAKVKAEAEAKKKAVEEAKRKKALQPDKKKAEEFINALSFSIEPPKVKDENINELLTDFIGHAKDLQDNFMHALIEIK